MLVSGSLADKPSRLVDRSEPIVLSGQSPRFVSRGGDKLDAALARFGVSVEGRIALDAGSSTGGFTDCLLTHGAKMVFAVDVGYGQLDWRLRADRRVHVLERVNVRLMRRHDLESRDGQFDGVDVVTADLSFISLSMVVPVLSGEILRNEGELVVLVKPQFEVGRVAAQRGKGVIRDPEEWKMAILRVVESLGRSGCSTIGVMASPLTGPAGNREFLVHAVKSGSGSGSKGLAAQIDAALCVASDRALRR